MIRNRFRQPKRTPCDLQEISSIGFSTFSSEQLNNYSVLQITETNFYENDNPVKGGLFDLKLGISGPDQVCETCGQSTECPGHIGHIKLQEPVMHYGFLKAVCLVLRSICFRCMRLRRSKDPHYKNKVKEIKRIIDPQQRLSKMAKLLMKVKKCVLPAEEEDLFDKNYKCCGGSSPSQIEIRNYKIVYKNQEKHTCVLDRKEIKKLLDGISRYDNECEALGFTKTKPSDLMIQSVVVPPPQIRPYVLIRSESKCEDDLSMCYAKIMKLNKEITSLRITHSEKTQLVTLMERNIASIMMKVKGGREIHAVQTKNQIFKNIKSISERLKGKQGRFRQNLLGKRVDFSARTVISPDPNLNLNEVGIPEKLANTLTFPERITSLNYNKILDLCLAKKVKVLINPPECSLRNEQSAINVTKIEATTRQEMAPYVNFGMIAQRVLQNGDFVLLNRQPTLHKMSMMAHKIKILPYNTFRVNLSVCMPYNADFDGDEMNIHIPQSYQSVSQLKNISSVQNQIVGPKNGTTSMGFSQDSLLGSVLLTSRNTFLNFEQITNLFMWASGQNMEAQDLFQRLTPPTIIKPQRLWTGKQIVNLLLPKEISMRYLKAKNMSECLTNTKQTSVIIQKGQILSGCLQKQLIGSSSNVNNIIHYIWMELGADKSQFFISNLQKMVYNWFLEYGFSIGASDVVPEQDLIKIKQQQHKQIQKIYSNIFNQYRDKNEVKLKHLHQQGRKIIDSFEFNVNLQLNNRLSKVQQIVKNTQNHERNSICKIVQAKSKGSETNLAQIMYTVGNQNINGERCPLGFSKRALPHFCKDDGSPAARGYVVSSFYSGLNPSQFFFHSMAGREGLSDTSIKTSKVGYIQRKIVKSLQDLIVKYDNSVRDSKNNLLQNFYGEDGFSAEFTEKHRCYGAQASKQIFREMYKWSREQLKQIFNGNQNQIIFISNQYRQLYRSRKVFKSRFCTNVQNPTYDYYCPASIDRIINKVRNTEIQKKPIQQQKLTPYEIYDAVQKLISECVLTPEKYHQNISMLKKQQSSRTQKEEDYNSFDEDPQQKGDFPENASKNYNQRTNLNSKSAFEIFKLHLRFCLSSKIIIKAHNLARFQFYEVIKQVKQKYFKSLAPAGEAVGCLAAQSIGEPTTQMTLNTFHLAGVSDRNVTLGLPRIQQLLNCTQIDPNSYLTIYPVKPILYSERTKVEDQEYLLDMLMFQLPKRKIGDFIYSSHYYFNPKENSDGEKENRMSKGDKKRTSWRLKLVFNYSKIGSKKIWRSLLSVIEKKARKQNDFEVEDVQDFDDVSQKAKNPIIHLRLLDPSLKFDVLLQQTLHPNRTSKLSKFSTIESSIREEQLCGINGISTVRISRRQLNLSSKQNTDQYVVFQASGTGLKQCLIHPEVNKLKTYSNSIREIANVLGIQAARQSLLNEFKEVLKPYGIVINYRHLSVLVDWMCMRGVMIPVSSRGLHSTKNVSALTKASYENPSTVLFNAAIFSSKNELKDTSEKIIFGQSTQCGTSQCQLMIDPEKIVKFKHRQQQFKNKTENILQDSSIWRTPNIQSPIFAQNQSCISANRSLLQTSITDKPLSIPYQMSPGFSYSPIVSFSPTYQSRITNSSPKYLDMKLMDGGKTDLTIKNISPVYQSISPNYRYGSASPSYNMLSMNKMGSPIDESTLTPGHEFEDEVEKDQDQF